MDPAQERHSYFALPSNKRVLLVNPPVFDFRYEWVKWNQPLDLLLLAGLLRDRQGCEVKLFDFMLPDSGGRVPRRPAELQVQTERPILNRTVNHFGRTIREFEEWLRKLAVSRESWQPDEVWISSLASFWWQSVVDVAIAVSACLGRARLVLYGNYPLLEPEHCQQTCRVIKEFVPTGLLDLSSETPAFDLYAVAPAFRAVDARSSHFEELIGKYYRHEVRDIVFFNEPLVDKKGTFMPTLEWLATTREQHPLLRVHGLCGLRPEAMDKEAVSLIRRAGFSEVHVEPYEDFTGGSVDRYRELAESLKRTGYLGSDSLSGGLSAFMYIGRPDDEVHDLVEGLVGLHSLFRAVILKPYSPTPGRSDHQRLRDQLGASYSPEVISPHRLPCRVFNGLTEGDYLELFRLAAFLNHPVRGHTFSFLDDSYLARALARSFRDAGWLANA